MYSKRWKDHIHRIVGDNVTQVSLVEEQEKCHEDNEKCIVRLAQNLSCLILEEVKKKNKYFELQVDKNISTERHNNVGSKRGGDRSTKNMDAEWEKRNDR
jgi:hypothetical protein